MIESPNTDTDFGKTEHLGQGKEDMLVSLTSDQPNVLVRQKWDQLLAFSSNSSTGGGSHSKLSNPTVVNNRMIRNQTRCRSVGTIIKQFLYLLGLVMHLAVMIITLHIRNNDRGDYNPTW